MSISQLSQVDVIFIKASFEYYYRLRCDQKIIDNITRGYTKEIAEKTVRGEHGCNQIFKSAIYQIDNIKFYTCPCNYRHNHMSFFMQAEQAYDKGILPFEGSLIDQPAYIMEAIGLIQNLKAEYEIEQRKKQSKE